MGDAWNLVSESLSYVSVPSSYTFRPLSVSTLEPSCFADYQTAQEVVPYFETVVNLFKQLNTFQALTAAGVGATPYLLLVLRLMCRWSSRSLRPARPSTIWLTCRTPFRVSWDSSLTYVQYALLLGCLALMRLRAVYVHE